MRDEFIDKVRTVMDMEGPRYDMVALGMRRLRAFELPLYVRVVKTIRFGRVSRPLGVELEVVGPGIVNVIVARVVDETPKLVKYINANQPSDHETVYDGAARWIATNIGSR